MKVNNETDGTADVNPCEISCDCGARPLMISCSLMSQIFNMLDNLAVFLNFFPSLSTCFSFPQFVFNQSTGEDPAL